MAQARKDAEVAKDKIVAEAHEAAQKERERAVADITSAKNQALRRDRPEERAARPFRWPATSFAAK